MVLPGSEGHECADVCYLDRITREVIVPCPCMLKPGDHAQFRDAEIGHDHRIHLRSIEVKPLAVTSHVPVEIRPLKRVGVIHFQLTQSRNDLVDSVAIGVVTVIPSNGLGFSAAIFADGDTVAARVDAVIVTKLFKLPEHFWAREQDVEALNGLLPDKRGVQIGHLVITVAIAKLQSFVHQPLFIMALWIRDDTRIGHALVLVTRPRQIRSVSHRSFAVIVGDVRPDHEPIVHQGLVFGEVDPMLQYHVNVGLLLPQMIGVFI